MTNQVIVGDDSSDRVVILKSFLFAVSRVLMLLNSIRCVYWFIALCLLDKTCSTCFRQPTCSDELLSTVGSLLTRLINLESEIWLELSKSDRSELVESVWNLGVLFPESASIAGTAFTAVMTITDADPDEKMHSMKKTACIAACIAALEQTASDIQAPQASPAFFQNKIVFSVASVLLSAPLRTMRP